MNSQLTYNGQQFQGLYNGAPVATDQLFYNGQHFQFIFPLNTSPANFLIMFE